MRSLYSTAVKSPDELSVAELGSFVALVNEGGEVGGGLKSRVKGAAALAMLHDVSGKLIGTAAIKKPYDSYRRDVFAKSKAELIATNYPYELGWIYLLEECRGRHLASPLISEVISRFKKAAIFGTARADNKAMHHHFCKQHFKRVGDPYLSIEHPDKEIVLFVREALGR